MNKVFTSTLCLAAMAASVTMAQQSSCATAADLVNGIHLDFADGTVETYRLIEPGRIAVQGLDAGALYFRLEIAQGTHLLSYVAVEDDVPNEGSRQTYDYGMSIEQLPVPSHGGRFTADVAVTSTDGTRQETQLQAYVAGEPLVVSGCSYDTINVLIAYDTSDNYMENIRYFPQLELGYLMWNQTDESRSDDNMILDIRTGK